MQQPHDGASDRYGSESAPQQQYEPRRNSVNPGYTPHSGYANQYTSGYQSSGYPPSDYQQSTQGYYPPQGGQPQYQGAREAYNSSPQPEYSTALAPYHPESQQGDRDMTNYPTYHPPRDDYTPSSSPSPDRKHRHSRSRGGRSSRDDSDDRSRGRSSDRRRNRSSSRRSKSRGKSIAAQAKNALKNNRDVASSALGVLAGGVIGSEVGRGNKFGTLAGAVLGGFGANYFEKKDADKKKERERKRYHSSTLR